MPWNFYKVLTSDVMFVLLHKIDLHSKARLGPLQDIGTGLDLTASLCHYFLRLLCPEGDWEVVGPTLIVGYL